MAIFRLIFSLPHSEEYVGIITAVRLPNVGESIELDSHELAIAANGEARYVKTKVSSIRWITDKGNSLLAEVIVEREVMNV